MLADWVDRLPAINAVLNGSATVLLIVGFILIRKKKFNAHAATMIAAASVSGLFLIGYLVHKFFRHDILLRSRFPNLSIAWAYFYWFVVLIPHLILAVAMLPFIGIAFWHAAHRRFEKHKRITRWLVWVWLYVSVTGVLIYFLLYHLFPVIGRGTTAS